MTAKRPRRTAERILDVTLAMFNRFGEPNVATAQLCAELGISPGNLFYHHPTREALVNALFQRYAGAVAQALPAPASAPVADPLATATPPSPIDTLVTLCARLTRVAWAYRFLFRDLNDLVSRHRELEEGLPVLLRRQAQALQNALLALNWQPQTAGGHEGPSVNAGADPGMTALWVGHVLACVCGHAGLDGALDPREQGRSDEDRAVNLALVRGLGMICPSLPPAARHDLERHLHHAQALQLDPWWLTPHNG